MREYVVEIVTEPTGEAMDDLLRAEIIQRLPTARASSGLSQDGHLAIRFGVQGEGPEDALRTGLAMFREVTLELGHFSFRLRKLTAGPPDEFDDE